MKRFLSLYAHQQVYQWRALRYAAVSVCGLAGLLVFEGWLNMLMMFFTAWPALLGCAARLHMRKLTK